MTATRPAYQHLELQPIAGQWRAGSSGQPLAVLDPFTEQCLLQISLANRQDLDQAYTKARQTQAPWAASAPAQRSQVLLNAARIFDERREEIIGWLVRESGSTRIKAQIEWGAARAIIVEAASLPSRVHGRIVASNVPGKESRVYRKPLGVIGVISPWNFPLHLSARSLAPALALGNAVVIKPASDTPVTGGLLLARIFEEAGLPAGVLSVVVGTGAEIGDAFVEHPVPGASPVAASTSSMWPWNWGATARSWSWPMPTWNRR
jgi:aldehyde dehydrogenase (NAD+)